MGSVDLLRAAIRGLALSLGALSLGTWASAQHRVWVVDARNGPGTDFTDLQLAVDRVPLGDILDVRDGSYGFSSGISVTRGVTIQFRSGAGLGGPHLQATIPARQTLVISGLRAASFPHAVSVQILGCAGTVSLQVCGLGWTQIRRSHQVTVVGGSSNSIDVEDATVAITRCRIVGASQSPPPYCFPAWGALWVRRGHVTLDACELASGWIDVSCARWYQGPTVFLQENSSLYLTRGTTVQHAFEGTLSGNATSGVVVLDPSIAPLAQSPGLRVERRVVPALHIEPPAAGRSATGALHAAGALGACAWVGRPIAAVPFPGLSGAWAVDPTQAILFLCGVPQNGVLGFTIAVPGDPVLVGEVVALQGLAWVPGMTVTTWVVELIRG